MSLEAIETFILGYGPIIHLLWLMKMGLNAFFAFIVFLYINISCKVAPAAVTILMMTSAI
jgi:hypothetical protein